MLRFHPIRANFTRNLAFKNSKSLVSSSLLLSTQRFDSTTSASATASNLSQGGSIPGAQLFSTTANNAGVQVQDMSAQTTGGGKIVMFGGDAREMMLAGIERIAKAVSVTLGPKGRNVVIRLPNGEPKITKDGVTVARSISFKNQFEDVGAKLVRQVASKTNDIAGDGTTTATVLAWSIFGEGYKAVATGANPMDLKRGIDSAVSVVLDSLKNQTRKVSGLEELMNVASISANGERRLGEMIARAVDSVGVHGFISVLDGRTSSTEWQRHDGWSTESGFVDSSLVTDTNTLSTEFGGSDIIGESLVFVSKDQLTSADDVLPILEYAGQQKKPLVIAARDVSGAALETVLMNHVKGVQKTCIVTPRRVLNEQQLQHLQLSNQHQFSSSSSSSSSGGGTTAQEIGSSSSGNGHFDEAALEDLAACCGCVVVNRDLLSRLHGVVSSNIIGTASRVSQTMDSTVVVGTADVSTRIRFLEKKLERCSGEVERDSLRERVAKLNKTFAVIRVGGQTSVEISESKDRVIDALNAARAALTGGIVAGGGAALIHASKELDKILNEDEDEDFNQDRRTGIFIVRNAIRLPTRTIGDNAGVEGPVVVQNILEEEGVGQGYDAQNDLYTDMFEAGIVDPVRVVECCIRDAASVAGLKITTEAIVCDDTGDVQQPLMSETISLLSGHSR